MWRGKIVWTAECTKYVHQISRLSRWWRLLCITVSVPICINPPQLWFDAAWPLDYLHPPSSRLPSYKSPTPHGGFAIRKFFQISHNTVAYPSEPDGLRRRRKGLGQTSSSYFPRTECCPGQSESLIANDVMGMMFPGIPSSQCCHRVLEVNNKQLCRLAMNVHVVSPPIANYSCIIAIRRDNQ